MKIFIEGGGDDEILQKACRNGFSSLLNKLGFNFKIVACGARLNAMDVFNHAVKTTEENEIPILLVDSEDPILNDKGEIDSPTIWNHLAKRESKFKKPIGASNKQVAVMATSMETWICADPDTLKVVFGSKFKEKKMPSNFELEKRDRKEVLSALESATKDCGRNKMYYKGKKSFEILGKLNPTILSRNLPNFKRLTIILSSWNNPPTP